MWIKLEDGYVNLKHCVYTEYHKRTMFRSEYIILFFACGSRLKIWGINTIQRIEAVLDDDVLYSSVEYNTHPDDMLNEED